MSPYMARSQKDSLLMLWESLDKMVCPGISMCVLSADQLPLLGASIAIPADTVPELV
jgi:hypothetical protein